MNAEINITFKSGRVCQFGDLSELKEWVKRNEPDPKDQPSPTPQEDAAKRLCEMRKLSEK